MVILGLDFGTTFSTIGLLCDSNSASLLKVGGTTYIRSVVAIKGRRYCIGDAAISRVGSDPSWSLFRDMKRWVGCSADAKNFEAMHKAIKPDTTARLTDEGLVLGSYRGMWLERSLKELMVLLLRGLVTSLEVKSGVKCSSLVISVPANFSVIQRRFYSDLSDAAGYMLNFILNEPSAAMISVKSVRVVTDLPELLVVYDFGGGTFDVSAISLWYSTFVVVATGGDLFLGGRDIDTAIKGFLESKHKIFFSERNDFSALKESCSRAKAQVTCPLIAANGQIVDITLEWGDFVRLTSPFVERTIEIVRKVYLQTGWDRKMKVLLVGGSSYLPTVTSELMKCDFIAEVRAADYPREAVAIGCCIYGRSRVDDGVKLYDILNTAIHDAAPACRPLILFPKYSPIPCVNSVFKRFPNSRMLRTNINIFEGQGNRSFYNTRIFSHEISTAMFGLDRGPVDFLYVCSVDSLGLFSITVKTMQTGDKEFRFAPSSQADGDSSVRYSDVCEFIDAEEIIRELGAVDYLNITGNPVVLSTSEEREANHLPGCVGGSLRSELSKLVDRGPSLIGAVPGLEVSGLLADWVSPVSRRELIPR